MNRTTLLSTLVLGFASMAFPQGPARQIAVDWKDAPRSGRVAVTNGKLAGVRLTSGRGTASGDRFSTAQAGPARLELTLEGSSAQYGPQSTLVTIEADKNPFSFFLHDVRLEAPILIRSYGVAVTGGEDSRSYAAIDEAARRMGIPTKLGAVEGQSEESFAQAASATRNLSCQTWLGLSRDIRIFAVGERLDWIQPKFHGREVTLAEAENKPVRYNMLFGRGWGATDRITRRLEQGVLPILHGTLLDDDISYEMTAFVSLERTPLSLKNLRGTHFLVADGYGHGHMFTPPQQAQFDALVPAELERDEETVLFVRVVAVNTARVPRYAFFKNVWPSPSGKYSFDGKEGLARYPNGRVFSVSRLNGRALSEEEVAIQLAPGEAATLEMFVPHRPLSAERAVKLAATDYAARQAECREFWKAKLASAAKVQLPEKRVDEMVRAGLLHLDLITYGLEPSGTLTSTIGVYSAIGSESSPIIQFMDSMGWHDVSRRALQYFLDKQHDDGFIQNFGGYMLETGAALWSMGEHYRYTRDTAWVRQIAPKLIKACEYLEKWRARNLREELRGKGYGMMEGKTADPEDPFRSFMLNGYSYLGLQRVSEMLETVDPAQSAKWRKEAEALKADIRASLFAVMGRSPVIPLADGSWCPTVPPWVEYRGPLSLYADGGKWFTHGAMGARDSLLGPLYLIFQEVVDPGEPAAEFLLSFHNDLMTTRNAAFTQPYYSRHPIAHLRRGEVKPFLKAYYNTFSSLADRQTYTFWEHYFGASPHKTHEEGWFLMDTRWMLYMERGDTLDLLPGIPRAFLEDGQRIELDRVASYFGPLSLTVTSDLTAGQIRAVVECRSERKPKAVELRLPHPLNRKATGVTGGQYDSQRERIRIAPFTGWAEVTLRF